MADNVVHDSKSNRTFMWGAITLHIGAKGHNRGHYVCARLLTRVGDVYSFVVLNDGDVEEVSNSTWQDVTDWLHEKTNSEITVTSALYTADTDTDDYKGRASHGVSNPTSTRCYAIAAMQMLEPILNGSVCDGGRDDGGGGGGWWWWWWWTQWWST